MNNHNRVEATKSKIGKIKLLINMTTCTITHVLLEQIQFQTHLPTVLLAMDAFILFSKL